MAAHEGTDMARYDFPLNGARALLPLKGREEPCATDKHHHGRGGTQPNPGRSANTASTDPTTARVAPCGLGHTGSKGNRRTVVGRLCAQPLGKLFHLPAGVAAIEATVQVLLDFSAPHRAELVVLER